MLDRKSRFPVNFKNTYETDDAICVAKAYRVHVENEDIWGCASLTKYSRHGVRRLIPLWRADTSNGRIYTIYSSVEMLNDSSICVKGVIN